jgi:hypothetical protein
MKERFMRNRQRLVVGLLVLALEMSPLMPSTIRAQSTNESIQGVWQAVEVTINGHKVKPQAELTLFTKTHYSRTEVQSEQPRAPLQDPAKATADELRAVWGPFVGEAGTYELTGDHVITMRAMVAKNPAVMTNGAFRSFSYRIEGDTIFVNMLRTQDGPITPQITIKAVRIE